MPLTLTANAKINLGLRIVGQREDPSGPDRNVGASRRAGGYHLLHTLFQEIDFGDEVTLTDQPSGPVSLEVVGAAADPSGPSVRMPDRSGCLTPEGSPSGTSRRTGAVPTGDQNLCIQAARMFQESTGVGEGVHIQLDKRIPMGAGLGGGSSDAAAVLKGLNELWQTGMTVQEMEGLAVELGADVPFFIRGGLQLGAGIGEVLTPLKRALPYSVVLVIPPFGVDTAWAYRQFASRRSFLPPPAFDKLITREPIPWEDFTNDFEEVVFPRYGQLAEIKAALLEQGAVYASLSGSGSAVYGLFAGPAPEAELKHRFAESQVAVCRAVSSG